MTPVRDYALWLMLAARRFLRNRRARLWGWLSGTEEPAERPLEPVHIQFVRRSEERQPLPAALNGSVLVLDAASDESAARRSAELLGLHVESGPNAHTVVGRAIAEHWPLVVAHAAALRRGTVGELLSIYVRRGGTLYLEGLQDAIDADLLAASRGLGCLLPRPREPASASALVFTEDSGHLTRELAGARVSVTGRQATLEQPSGWVPVVLVETAAGLRPAVLELRAGSGAGPGGRIVAASLPSCLNGTVAAALAPGQLAAAVFPLTLVRSLYGDAALHPPAVLANITIDDPALTERRLGLPFTRLAGLARELGFHLTVATIPAELFAADPAVVGRLAAGSRHLSACYHGCNHDGYEFGLDSDGEAGPRLQRRQRAALIRAAEHGQSFARSHGLALDRVMVFPHGIGPAYLLPELQRLGFLASSNYPNRYPLAHPIPTDADLGARPADLAWHGFPLLWRRPLEDSGWPLDLVLGRPLLMFGHTDLLDSAFDGLFARTADVSRMATGPVAWRGLEEVARHAYLQRRRPGAGWEVLMTANEACLHNPDAAPRSYLVHRPYLPPGCFLEVDGTRGPGPAVEITVAPFATGRVRVASDAAPALPAPRWGCSIMTVPPPAWAPSDPSGTGRTAPGWVVGHGS